MRAVLGKGEPHELRWDLLEQVERAEGGWAYKALAECIALKLEEGQ